MNSFVLNGVPAKSGDWTLPVFGEATAEMLPGVETFESNISHSAYNESYARSDIFQ